MLYEDPRNRCCCGVHVVTGANVIAGFGVAMSLCLVILALVYGRWLLAAGPFVFAFAYASIFYAFHGRHPRLYWPFLIINGLVVAAGSIYILVLLAMFLVMPNFWQRSLNEFTDYQMQDTIHQFPRLVTACIASVMLVVQVMNIWFELVIYNASSFIRREHYLAKRQGAVYKV